MSKNREKTVKELRQEKREKEEREIEKSEKKENALINYFKKFSPLSLSIIAGALVLVIAFSVIAGVLIYRASNPYRDVGNPVAEISMSDGNKLVFQLFYDEAPIAVTMFHYFAYHKYYNGTIIDAKTPAQNGDSLKLGRYTGSVAGWDNPKVRMLQGDSYYNNGNFTVYMKDDSNAKRQKNEAGALSTIKLSYGASAEFQICAAQGQYGYGASDGWVFGWAYDDATLSKLRAYAQGLQTEVDGTNIVPAHEVKIKSIKFYNDKALKKRINYADVKEYLSSVRRDS